MITNQVLLFLLVFCFLLTNQIKDVRGSEKSTSKDAEIFDNLEDLDEWDDYESFSGSKNTFSEASKTKSSQDKRYNKTKKRLRRRSAELPKYFKDSYPISTEIDSSKTELLKTWETRLLSSNISTYKWDLTKMDNKTAKHLCQHVWISRTPKFKISNNMTPDCDTNKLLSASNPHLTGKKYQIHFYYLELVEDNEFIIDLLRCNCAYIAKNTRNKTITVVNSKEFFFLFTHDELVYFVATTPPELRLERIVRIVDVIQIPSLQE